MGHEKGPGCFPVAQWPVWAARGRAAGLAALLGVGERTGQGVTGSRQ